jgi:hypothetical protein
MAYDHIAYSQVESDRFRRFCETISDDYAKLLPLSHSTVQTWLLSVYQDKKALVIERLRAALSQIHFSFDLWTSPKQSIGLLATIGHFVNSEYTNEALLLSLRPIEGAHTGENMAEAMLATFEEYDITEIGYFMSDNHPANDLAVKAILAAHKIPETVKSRRLRCFGHIINLVAHAFLFGQDQQAFETDDWQDLATAYRLWKQNGPIGQVHYLFVFIQGSHSRRENFLKLQDDRKALQPIDPNKTRWNSTYYMLKRAVKLRKAVDLFCLQYIDIGELDESVRISADTWVLIEQLCAILEEFEVATTELEGHGAHGYHGSLYECLPSMEDLLGKLETLRKLHPTKDDRQQLHSSSPSRSQPQSSSRRGKASQYVAPLPATPDRDDFLAIAINNAWVKLNKYYALSDDSVAYVAALVLHPQYKWKFFETTWAARPDWIQEAKAKVQSLWDTYKAAHPIAEQPPQPPPSEPALGKRRRPASQYAFNALAGDDSDEEEAIDDYNYYCEREKRVKMVDGISFNPLYWWRDQTKQFPDRYRLLGKLALNLLSIPAMSAEPERLFSSSRRLMTWERLALAPNTIEANECLRHWLPRLGVRTIGATLINVDVNVDNQLNVDWNFVNQLNVSHVDVD